MATLEQERQMRKLAKKLKQQLRKMYGQEMSFFLVTAPFGDGQEAVADYISNAHRADGIRMLRETADRLDQGQDIPAAQGAEQ